MSDTPILTAEELLTDAIRDALLVPAQELGDSSDVLGNRHVRKETDLLDDVPDFSTERVLIQLTNIGAINRDAAAGLRRWCGRARCAAQVCLPPGAGR